MEKKGKTNLWVKQTRLKFYFVIFDFESDGSKAPPSEYKYE